MAPTLDLPHQMAQDHPCPLAIWLPLGLHTRKTQTTGPIKDLAARCQMAGDRLIPVPHLGMGHLPTVRCLETTGDLPTPVLPLATARLTMALCQTGDPLILVLLLAMALLLTEHLRTAITSGLAHAGPRVHPALPVSRGRTGSQFPKERQTSTVKKRR